MSNREIQYISSLNLIDIYISVSVTWDYKSIFEALPFHISFLIIVIILKQKQSRREKINKVSQRGVWC